MAAPVDYYDSKQSTGREEASSDLLILRNLNNFIKSALIQLSSVHLIQSAISSCFSPSFSVLEVSCGALGDQRKWFSSFPDGMLDRFDGFDISEGCIARAHERLLSAPKKVSSKIRLQVWDASKDWPYIFNLDVYHNKLYSVVSCQMALHYFVTNTPSAEQFLQKCHKVLKKGGLVVLTLPDSDVFAKRLIESKNPNKGRTLNPNGSIASPIPRSFGNDLYTVDNIQICCTTATARRILCSTDPEDFFIGGKYRFTLPGCVEQCEENFIPWRSFVHLAEQVGFKLLLRENFETFATSQWDVKSLSNPSTPLRNLFSLGSASSFQAIDPAIKEVSSFYSVLVLEKL